MSQLYFAKSHEWVRFTEEGAEVGLSDHAQQALGDLVFVNLPAVGDPVEAGVVAADVESVKAVSDIYSPVSGTVSAVNDALLDAPERINEAPYEAWLFRVEDVSEKGELMTEEDYAQYLAQEE